MRKVSKTLSQLVGPAAGGALFAVAGATGAIAVSIVLLSLAIGWLIPIPRLPTSADFAAVSHQSDASEPTSPVARTRPVLFPVIMLVTLANSFLVGLVIAVGVPHLGDDPSAPEGAYGYALAFYSSGAVIGAWVAGRIRWRDQSIPLVLKVSAFGYGVIAAGGMIGPWWTILISWFLWGVCFGPEDIVTDRYLVSHTRDQRLARLYALWSNVGRVGAAAAYAAVYFRGQRYPTQLTLHIALGFACAMPLLLWFVTRGPGRIDEAA